MNADHSARKNYPLFCIIIAALLLTLPWLDRPFHTRGEPREALVAQSMLVTNNWISPPAYNGAVPSKPPFNHWLISLVSLPGGEVTEFTARLPSAIAVVLFSAFFYIFLRRRTSERSALLAGLILLSSFEWLRSAVTCRVDTILSASVAGALLALFGWRERGRKGFPFLAAFFIACAALTKGPIGVALPLAIFSLFELLSGEKTVRNVVAIGLRGAVIAVPVVLVMSLWYLGGYLQRGDVFIDKIYYENFARLTSSMEDEPHKHAAPYMVLMLAVGLLPWTLVWLTTAVRHFSKRDYTISAFRRMWRNASDLQRYAFISAVFIFVFFCIPSSKRSVYILPAYPFIAILAAESFAVWGERSKRLMVAMSKTLMWFSFCIAGLVTFGLLVPVSADVARFGSSLLASVSMWRVGVLVVLCVLMARVSRGCFAKDGAQREGHNLIIERYTNTLRSIMRAVIYGLPYDLPMSKYDRLYSFGSEAYATSFYLKKPFFAATPGLSSGSLIVVEEKNLERLKQQIAPNVREVARFSSGLEPSKKSVLFVEIL